MKAKDIMVTDVVMVEESFTVEKALKIMVEKKVSSLIVNRVHDDDSYGIITRRDIVNKMVAAWKDPAKTKVKNIMTKPLLVISPNLSIHDIARLMVHTNVRRMPVFDGHDIMGIVSNSDIFLGYADHIKSSKEFID
ncbi:MAG: CBS domain-containing protein [bacterium]